MPKLVLQPSFRAVGQTHAEWQTFEKELVLICSDEELTLETSAYNHLHDVKLIHINLRLIHYTLWHG